MKGPIMSDDDQVIGQQEPEGKQEAPMPSEVQPAGEQELPVDVSERTRQEFEKLKESNRKLKEELEARKPEQPVEYGPNYTFLNERQVDAITDDFVDAEGNVDIVGLNKALKLANQRAERAESLVSKIEKRERQKMVVEAHSKHPYLDPNGSAYDPKFYGLVRDRLVREFAEGKDRPLVEVADEIATFYKPVVSEDKLEQVKQDAVEQYKQTQQTKAQVSAVGSTQKRAEEPSYEDLRKRTREGDRSAFAERLRRAGL
jgi:hypothetical protein